jgi:hypothetical protein
VLSRAHLRAALALTLAHVGCGDADSVDPVETAIPAQDGSFEALTYNVAGLPQGLSGSNPEAYIPLISPLLNAYDLCLVQEDFVYHAELVAEADHPHQSVPKEDYVKLVHDGLNQLSTIPWSELERVQWEVCFGDASGGAADCMAEKGFTFSRLEVGEGVSIDLYNLHADAGGGPEDEAARAVGFEQLADFVLARSEGRAILIGGDTNLHRDDPPDVAVLDLFLASTGLRDAGAVLGAEDRIDRFFFRDGDAVALEPRDYRIPTEFVDAEGNDLSDHEPVAIRVGWKTK